MQCVLSRLQDSRDQEMHLIVSTLTLLFEVALTALIVARVPCTMLALHSQLHKARTLWHDQH